MPYRRFVPTQPYRLEAKNGELVCMLSGAQLDDLLDLLVEEHQDDQDYWFDVAVLDWLENAGADRELLAKLRVFITRRGPSELRWAVETTAPHSA